MAKDLYFALIHPEGISRYLPCHPYRSMTFSILNSSYLFFISPMEEEYGLKCWVRPLDSKMQQSQSIVFPYGAFGELFINHKIY